jgi:hypothetical protein
VRIWAKFEAFEGRLCGHVEIEARSPRDLPPVWRMVRSHKMVVTKDAAIMPMHLPTHSAVNFEYSGRWDQGYPVYVMEDL